MKKMNLIFFGFKPKIVYMLFLLFGLLMITSSKINAQYVSQNEAKKLIEKHISELPDNGAVASFNSKNLVNSSNISVREKAAFDNRFGKQLLHYIVNENKSVSDAMKESYKKFSLKNKSIADLMKQEYDQFLFKS